MNLGEIDINIKSDFSHFSSCGNKMIFDCKVNNKISINIKENTINEVLIYHLNKETEIDFIAGNNSEILLSLIAEENINNLKINGVLKENSKVYAFFADFSEGKCNCNISFDLKDVGATIYWHLASLSSKNDDKKFDVSCFHLSPFTFAKIDNYGVCKDEAKLSFAGISEIKQGCYSSETYQNAKIMVFDQRSHAIAKPILKIDENDIEASHAAVVGEINEEHLFYLTSRGISEAHAKQLITYGYLKPIISGFNKEEDKKLISTLIEERM